MYYDDLFFIEPHTVA